MASPLRLGTVPYLAARPCLGGLDDDPRFALVRATPAELVDSLRAGDFDAALVSSIEAFQRPGYRFVPSVAIAADGDVRSVLLFARRPVARCRTLALDPASRTGAALARIAIHAVAGEAPRCIEVSRGADPAGAGADAWLRIGDAALREGRARRGSEVEVVDLAALWKSITGLPFVFALWLVGPGAPVRPEHAAALRAARDRGCAERPRLARAAAAELGMPEEEVRSYLVDACRYDLDAPGMREGLAELGRRARALGLAPLGITDPLAVI